jgi:hypothetical protein
MKIDALYSQLSLSSNLFFPISSSFYVYVEIMRVCVFVVVECRAEAMCCGVAVFCVVDLVTVTVTVVVQCVCVLLLRE